MMPATLRAFAVVWFVYFAAIGLFNTYAPLWYSALGLPALAIGLIASMQSWTRVLAPYAWGWLADHSGRRIELLRLGALLSALAALGLALTGSWGLGPVMLFVVLLFLSNGAIVPLAEAAVAHHLRTDEGLDTVRYARVRVWGSLGFIAAVIVFGALLQAAGVTVFGVSVVLVFGALVGVVWRLPVQREPVATGAAAAGVGAVLRRPEVAWFFAGIGLTVLAHTSLYTFFSLFLDAQGLGHLAVGLLWSVAVAVEVLFFWYQGRWFRRLSLHGWLLLAAAVAALRFALMAAFGHLTWLLVLTQATHALTFAAQHAACIALIDRYFPGRLRGRGQALYSTLGYGLSGVLGGVAGGALVTHFGYAAVFWAASVAALLGMACLWHSRRCARTGSAWQAGPA